MENALKSKIKLNNLMSLILHYLTRSNQLFLKVKSNELKLDVHYKANNEKFTDADWILQKMFENYFSKYFPTLKIIGEENTSDDLIKSSEFFSVNEEVNMNIIEESQIPKNLTEINSEDLTIYIDPIDSTEQFIKRNFGPVTTLVGITLRSIPIVGFIYFNQFDLDGKAPRPLVLMNIPQKGIFFYHTDEGKLERVSTKELQEDEWSFVSSGSRTSETIKNIFSLFPGVKTSQAHGIGGKAYLSLVEGTLFFVSGKSKEENNFILDLGFWDVCAADALSREIGGGLFYLSGEEVEYPKDENIRNLDRYSLISNSKRKLEKFLEIYEKCEYKLD